MPRMSDNMLYRSLILGSSIDQEHRTASISFSSETKVPRRDWWSGDSYNEILGHESGNVDFKRLQELGVVLFNHDPNRVLGAVSEVSLDTVEHRCKATIRFDTDEESEKIYQKVLAGTLKGISVGYRVKRWEEVKAGAKSTCGRFEGPCRIAREWEPLEISVVSIPADTGVGVGRAMGETINLDGLAVSKEVFTAVRSFLEKEEKQRQQLQDSYDLMEKELKLLEME